MEVMKGNLKPNKTITNNKYSTIPTPVVTLGRTELLNTNTGELQISNFTRKAKQ